ncbi:MAG: metallophosphoesterase [Polaromonas sp.]
MKILHLSDLHIDTSILRDQKVVLKALFADIRTEVFTNGAFDLVFFTGDLIAKGGYSQENIQAAKDEFLKPLLLAANVPAERLYVVPGNHDVNLKLQSKNLARSRETLDTNEAQTQYLDEATQANTPATGLEKYNDLINSLGRASPVLENNHYRAFKLKVGSISIGIGEINTAWCATGAESDGDYGKLLVSGKQIDEIVSALDGVDLKLALMHHPISWMRLKDSRNLHRQLLLHFDGLFHGHNHEPDAQSISGTSNNYFVSNAGCLYQSREYFNGYCITRFDHLAQKWDVDSREYIEGRQSFDKALRFGPDGHSTFFRVRNNAAQNVPVLPSDEYIEALHASFNGHLLSTLVSTVAPPSLRSIFVDPPISKVSPRQFSAEKSNGGNAVFLPLKDVLATRKSTLFVGTKDIGKTTLLHHICSLSLDFGQSDFPSFAAYIDLESTGETRAAILESITSFGRGAYRRSEFLGLLGSGSIAICFDNIKSARSKQLKAVRDLCAEFPKCRFFFSVNEEVEYSLSVTQLPKLTDELDVLYLHPFGRKETRQLTQKWYDETPMEASAKVDEVLSLLARLNIPRSPFLISALLWIREKQVQFAPVNQAEILDALIDGVMEKLSESKDRSGLDASIKRHFLAALAEHLYKSDSRRISSHGLDAFTVNYFGAKGLLAPSGPFLAELKRKGILLEVGSDVTFMFDSIRAFFLSSRLQESTELMEQALDPEHFLSLGEELDYFTGRHRDNREVLERVAAIVQGFRRESGLASDLKVFDTISMKESPNPDHPEGDLALAIEQHRPTDQSREDILESIDEQTRFRGPNEVEEIRLQRLTGSVGKYLEALRIGSAVLRNSELVNDLPLKHSVYKQFAQCWSEIMIAVILSVDSKDKENQGLDVLRSLLPTGNPTLAAYLLKMLAPNVIMSLAAESLGTAKLQLIIEDHIKTAASTVEKLTSTFLSVDLEFSGRFKALQSLLDAHKNNRYVAELIFFKLMQLYFFSRLNDRDLISIREVIGSAVTLMMSVESQNDRNAMKSRLLSGLDKSRLLRS